MSRTLQKPVEIVSWSPSHASATQTDVAKYLEHMAALGPKKARAAKRHLSKYSFREFDVFCLGQA